MFHLPVSTRLRRGLVGYWPLEEASGTRNNALGRASYPLTDTNTVTGATGPSTALPLASHFTRANAEQLVSGTAGDLRGAKQIHITFWANLSTKPVGGFPSGVFLRDTTYGIGVYFTVSSDRWTIQAGNGATSPAAFTPAGTVTDTGTWYFIDARYDGGQIRLSQNLRGGTAVALSGGLFSTAADVMRIGSSAVGGQAMDGDICHVGIWDRVLSPAELRYLYNNGAGRDLRTL